MNNTAASTFIIWCSLSMWTNREYSDVADPKKNHQWNSFYKDMYLCYLFIFIHTNFFFDIKNDVNDRILRKRNKCWRTFVLFRLKGIFPSNRFILRKNIDKNFVIHHMKLTDKWHYNLSINHLIYHTNNASSLL